MMPHGNRNAPPSRSDYAAFIPITTRWSDNDIYGHVNNAVAYFYFDTAVNSHLIAKGVLDIHHGNYIGLVVETRCSYHAPMEFPDSITAGIRADHIGSSSVRYGVALFPNDDNLAAAHGEFTHVYVDRKDRRPRPLSDGLRSVLHALKINDEGE